MAKGEHSYDLFCLFFFSALKERQCRELQEARRKVSLQVESWEEQARRAETTVIELRLEIHNSNIEILRLKERADSLENSLQQVTWSS